MPAKTYPQNQEKKKIKDTLKEVVDNWDWADSRYPVSPLSRQKVNETLHTAPSIDLLSVAGQMNTLHCHMLTGTSGDLELSYSLMVATYSNETEYASPMNSITDTCLSSSNAMLT